MRRFEAHAGWVPPALLPRYAASVRRFQSREERFPSQVLLAFTARGAEGFELRAAADGEPTEILLYDEIGYWGVTAKDFVLALAAAGPGPITLRINSPGGDTFDGLAIYNALRARTSPVTVVVDGIAASAASFIAMAAQKIEMPEQAMLMIHNCWGLCIGNRNDMLDMAAVQEKIDGMMAQIYAGKSGKSAAEMSAAMDAETYYTSTEAKAIGLCDSIIPAADVTARVLSSLRAASFRAFKPSDIDRAQLTHSQALPDYDPDGDGDNDAEEALGMVNAAIVLLQEAAESLSGTPDPDEAGESETADPAMPMPVVPGASAEAGNLALQVQVRLRRHRLAAVEAA